MVKPVGIVRQYVIESGDLGWQVNRTEPEVEDPGVWLPLAEDELTEVTIECDQNALIANGDGQDLRIVQGWSVVGGDKRNIVATTSKVGSDASIGALVDEESQRHVSASCTAPCTMRGLIFRDLIA